MRILQVAIGILFFAAVASAGYLGYTLLVDYRADRQDASSGDSIDIPLLKEPRS